MLGLGLHLALDNLGGVGLGYQRGWNWTTPFLISPPWKDSPSQTETNRSVVLQLSHILLRLWYSHPLNHSLRKNCHLHLICSCFQAKISECGEIKWCQTTSNENLHKRMMITTLLKNQIVSILQFITSQIKTKRRTMFVSGIGCRTADV